MHLALNLPAAALALLAGCGTWLVTALGAAAVFFFSRENERHMTGLLGFAAGVMLAASYELIPACRREDSYLGAMGVILGFALMMLLDVALG